MHINLKIILIKKLLSIYKHELFNPGFIGAFINPFFFVRRGLVSGIKRYSKQLNGKLLDYGCGSKPYKDFFKVDKYIGVDVISRGHPHDTEEIDVYYDGKSLPFIDEAFDSVFCSEVFEHIFELEEALVELKRVMRINGTALFTVPFVWDEHEAPFDFGRYSSFGIKYLLEKNGFEIIHLEKSTKFLETIFQFWNLYLFYKLYTKNKYVNILINIIFIAPFTILGIIVSGILPNNGNLYNNNIILAKRIL